MSFWTTHPRGVAFLNHLSDTFLSQEIAHKADRKIIFLCGGPLDSNSVRKQFSEFATQNIHNYRFFLAESAARSVRDHRTEPRFINLSAFESVIAGIADCILIFPESYGSIAELGFFSAWRDMRRKILVANDIAQQGESFINNGPLASIAKETEFQPTILLDYSNNPDFNTIKTRLLARLSHKYSKWFTCNATTYLGHRVALAIIFEIIRILRICDLDDLKRVSATILGNGATDHLEVFLGILHAADYVRYVDDEARFIVNPTARPFVELRRVNSDELIARATNVIYQTDPHTLELLS